MKAIHKLKANRWLKSLNISRFDAKEGEKAPNKECVENLAKTFPDLNDDPDFIAEILQTLNEEDPTLDLDKTSDFLDLEQIKVCFPPFSTLLLALFCHFCWNFFEKFVFHSILLISSCPFFEIEHAKKSREVYYNI